MIKALKTYMDAEFLQYGSQIAKNPLSLGTVCSIRRKYHGPLRGLLPTAQKSQKSAFRFSKHLFQNSLAFQAPFKVIGIRETGANAGNRKAYDPLRMNKLDYRWPFVP